MKRLIVLAFVITAVSAALAPPPLAQTAVSHPPADESSTNDGAAEEAEKKLPSNSGGTSDQEKGSLERKQRDRLTHHARVTVITGESYRQRSRTHAPSPAEANVVPTRQESVSQTA